MSRRSHAAPRIFFSYSHKDGEFGTNLVKLLRQVLGDEDAVWYDDGLVAGEDWWDRIMKELTSRNYFIVLLSPDALKSEYVKTEMKIAWQRRMGKNMQFIPLMYRKCRIPSYLTYLNTRQFVSFIPPKDHKTSYQKLFEALGVHSYAESLISNAEMLDTAYAQLKEDKDVSYPGRLEGIVYIQKMVLFVEEAFNRQEWNDVVTVTKALISLYPQLITSLIYKMRGYACLHTEEMGDNRYTLAQEAFEAALALENDPEQRLDLLDAYVFTLMQQDRWDDVGDCINEAEKMLKSAPNNFVEKTWQILRDEMPIVYQESDILVSKDVNNNRVRIVKDMALVILIANFLFSLLNRILKKHISST